MKQPAVKKQPSVKKTDKETELDIEIPFVPGRIKFLDTAGALKVNIKKTNPYAKAPTYATDGSGCFDLYSCDTGYTSNRTFDTGLAFEVPVGHVLLVYSRSGMGFNSGLSLVNSVGVIDSDYRDSVKVKFSGPNHLIKQGDRIAQGMIIPYPKVVFTEVEELNETERGTKGFGSSGK